MLICHCDNRMWLQLKATSLKITAWRGSCSWESLRWDGKSHLQSRYISDIGHLYENSLRSRSQSWYDTPKILNFKYYLHFSFPVHFFHFPPTLICFLHIYALRQTRDLYQMALVNLIKIKIKWKMRCGGWGIKGHKWCRNVKWLFKKLKGYSWPTPAQLMTAEM